MPITTSIRYKNSKVVVEEYLDRLKHAKNSPHIKAVRILGSFGRFDVKEESDMDIWLICNDNVVRDLSLLKALALEERKIRTVLGKKYHLPFLDRHFASIFSSDEARLYDASFYTRVQNPYLLGEIIHLDLDIKTKTHIDKIILSEPQKKADLIQSLIEFKNNWNSAVEKNLSSETSQKWLRRIVQEITYQKSGVRISDSLTLDKKIDEIYMNHPQNIIEDIDSYITQISTGVNKQEIEKVRNAHSIMWTLEKVRWELINSEGNMDYFNNWRLGYKKECGFSPREIGNLVRDISSKTIAVAPSTPTFSKSLIKLTRISSNKSHLRVTNKFLKKWACETAKIILDPSEIGHHKAERLILPTSDNSMSTISQIFPNEESRFASSEISAWKILNSGNLLKKIDLNDYKIVIQRDILSDRLTTNKIRNYLDQYAIIAKSLHSHPVDYFGRLADNHHERCYSDYLLMRLNNLHLKNPLIKRISELVTLNKSILDRQRACLCHMDPGPRNLIVAEDDKLHLIDYEHASGCSHVWDLERILFQLPPRLHDKFLSLYQTDIDPIIFITTRAVMLVCFASKLSTKYHQTKYKCLDYIEDLVGSWPQEKPRLVIISNQ